MARRLGEELNEMKLQDNLSGSEIVLYYRMPETEERVAYSSESLQRKGRKIIQKTVETRLKYGARILAGFRTGDFEKKKDGKWLPLASDPESEHYDPDWKVYLQKHAADVIELLALRVFDAPVQTLPGDEEDETPDGDKESDDSDPN